jgi:dodecin
MSVLKYIELTGESETSWESAAQAAVEAASKTLRELRHLEVIRLTARFEPDLRMIYQATLKLAFAVEGTDEQEALVLQQAVEIVSEEPLA